MDILKKIADTVIAGDPDKQITELVEEALAQNVKPIDILQKGLREGIDIVGQRFEEMQLFLPEMVMAANVMIAGVEVLRPHFDETKGGGAMKNVGAVVIGTVHHDLHDIGKNIVSTFLDVSGFEVHDIGVDVSAQAFVDKAQETGADIIAVSALLSTTAPFIKDVIKELELRDRRDKHAVVVGGGIVTQKLADQIGADGYGKDFSAAVQVSKELIRSRR